jgi:hypothetical protein
MANIFKKTKEKREADLEFWRLNDVIDSTSILERKSKLEWEKSVGTDIEYARAIEYERNWEIYSMAVDALSLHVDATRHLFPIENLNILKESKTIRTAEEALLAINSYLRIAAELSEISTSSAVAVTTAIRDGLDENSPEVVEKVEKLRIDKTAFLYAMCDVDEITLATKHLF